MPPKGIYRLFVYVSRTTEEQKNADMKEGRGSAGPEGKTKGTENDAAGR